MSVECTRRYYLLKRLYLRDMCLEEDPWPAKQAAESGTTLPDDFVHLSALQAAGYTAVEDVDGALPGELVKYCGLTEAQAIQVLAALAAL